MSKSILSLLTGGLSYPQNIYLNQFTTPFKAYVGGYGSGKTFVGCIDLLNFISVHPGITMAYFGPTYATIRDVFYPTIEEAGKMLGFTCDIKVANREVHLYRGEYYYGTIICRSMDNPDSIIGFKFDRAFIDELDTLASVEKQQKAWNKIIARRRGSIDFQVSVGVTTTPEGFKHTYDLFADNPSKSYSMVQASSYENKKYLPIDYIPTLKETYSPELVNAYVNGLFVNLVAGTVYNMFDRSLNHTPVTENIGEYLHIGMDFNVTNMSGIVHVIRNGNPIAVDELSGIYDTPGMIDVLKGRYRDHPISIYPDATGKNRESVDASTSDIAELETAGYHCVYNDSNPRIKDRTASMNRMFLNAKDQRRYKVNTVRCPGYTKDLEQQSYDKSGMPDKSGNNDHRPDAGGYFIYSEYPINRPETIIGYQLSV